METLPPHVNLSDQFFSVVEEQNGEKKIVFGLGAIRGAGEDAMSSIIECRKSGGEFKDLEDFISRVDFSKITKRVMEPLIKSGSLDNLGYTRATMLKYIDEICEIGRNKQKLEGEIHNSLFADSQDELTGIRFSFSDIEGV